MPAWQLRDRIVAGEISAVEAVKQCFARIAALEPTLHCFVTLAEESALATAERLDSKRRAGAAPGPLFGVPISIKDQYWTAGLRSTGGSKIFEDFTPDEDSTVAARLRAADAVIIGKTATPEFGMFWRAAGLVAAETCNPWDTDRVSGGSSGGAAASVAAGITAVAIGSDGGGSIRVPSSFCGVFGLHPSIGRVSRHGGHGGALQFTVVGPISRSVRDAAMVFDAIAGFDPKDPVSSRAQLPATRLSLDEPLPRLKCAFWQEAGPLAASHNVAVAAACREAIFSLPPAILEIAETGSMPHLSEWETAFQIISKSDRFALHGQPLYENEASRAKLTPYARDTYDSAAQIRMVDYARAVRTRLEAIQFMDGMFEDFDVIASPTIGMTAPPPRKDLSTRPQGLMTYSFSSNLLGTAAINVPVGFVENMPVGLQFIAPRGKEDLLLRLALRLEREFNWSDWQPGRGK